MNATWHGQRLPLDSWLKSVAAGMGAVVVAAWLAMLVAEALRWQHWVPYPLALNQAICLGLVFASYLVGWRYYLAGAAMAIFGTALYFVVTMLGTGVWPEPVAALLGAPGVVYLVAWIFTDRRR